MKLPIRMMRMIGKATVLDKTPERELIQVDIDEEIFSVVRDNIRDEYYNSLTNEHYRKKYNASKSITLVTIKKKNFINGKFYNITLARFNDTGFYLCDYALK